jgi:hypothetical protein
MWIQRLLDVFSSKTHNTGNKLTAKPEAQSQVTISYVRAVEGRKPSSVDDNGEKIRWKEREIASGRFIVSDSHFAIGGYIRSVPRLKPVSECSLLRDNS